MPCRELSVFEDFRPASQVPVQFVRYVGTLHHLARLVQVNYKVRKARLRQISPLPRSIEQEVEPRALDTLSRGVPPYFPVAPVLRRAQLRVVLKVIDAVFNDDPVRPPLVLRTDFR